MNICILGNGLTALSLAKNLTKKNINVRIYETKKTVNSSLNRTIGITKKNLEFLNKEILALQKKDTWPIKEIEIFSEKEKKDKILNFKKKDILFYMIKNDKYYYHLNNALKKDNFFRKKIITKKFSFDKMIKENKYDLIINCDPNNPISKKYFSRKISKDYFNRAYTGTIIHEKFDNNKAVQIFTKCGPIAYLPLSQTETSVVCSLNLKNKSEYTNEEVLTLIDKNNPGFVLKKISDLKSFKLNLANLRNYSHENILAFGDLLHKIHPLAGQGFNMTLRDIKVLSDLIEERIDEAEAFEKTAIPFRTFMLRQVRDKDLSLFEGIAKVEPEQTGPNAPLQVLIPAFMISELRRAFEIGFLIYLPFVIIDMVVASILMSMGMMMMPPVVISMPFKLLLFVLVDGWYLIVQSLVGSFNIT